jgi:hypothetical protein
MRDDPLPLVRIGGRLVGPRRPAVRVEAPAAQAGALGRAGVVDPTLDGVVSERHDRGAAPEEVAHELQDERVLVAALKHLAFVVKVRGGERELLALPRPVPGVHDDAVGLQRRQLVQPRAGLRAALRRPARLDDRVAVFLDPERVVAHRGLLRVGWLERCVAAAAVDAALVAQRRPRHVGHARHMHAGGHRARSSVPAGAGCVAPPSRYSPGCAWCTYTRGCSGWAGV